MHRRPTFLLLVLIAVALGLVRTDARAATTSTGSTSATLAAPGASVSYSGHLGDNTVADPVACPPQSLDAADMTCGHLGLVVDASGPVTATVRFPADQELDLAVCRPETIDTTPLDHCTGGTEVALTSQDQTTTPDGAFTLTETITFTPGPGCTTSAPCVFELRIVPVFVFTCTFDLVPTCPGVDFTGTVSLGGNGGGGTGNGGGGPVPDPPVSIADAAVNEGDAGTKAMTFVVTLGWTSRSPITVNYATSDGTAGATDYLASTGLVTFNPGVTEQTVSVPVVGDVLRERNETFAVQLFNPQPSLVAHIDDGNAVGRILDDDPGHTVGGSGRVGSGPLSISVRENLTGKISFADGKGFRFRAASIDGIVWNDLTHAATIRGTSSAGVAYVLDVADSPTGDTFRLTLADGRSFGGTLTSGNLSYRF
jgi:hypothetical protein